MAEEHYTTGPRFGQYSNPQPKIHYLESGDP